MRQLTLEERVRATEAIERTYEAHRIWPAVNPAPRPSFESRFPRSLIESKVRDGLRKGAALQALWHRPVTVAQIQAEMERIARDTKNQAMLEELFHALGNDPVVIAECLVRPLLTERLLDGWYAGDRSLHAQAWARAERALRELRAADFESYPEGELRHVIYTMGSGETGADPAGALGERQRLVVGRDELALLRSELGGTGSPRILDRHEGVDVVLVVRDDPDEIEVLSRTFAKESRGAWWDRVRSTFPEALPRAEGAAARPRGRAVRASCDTWTGMNTTGLPPIARAGHSAVWTGAEMIVWGGGWSENSGGRYDPATDTWLPTSTAGACPSARPNHTAVWTGTEMIVWGGGYGGGLQNSGGRYDPVSDSWTATSTSGACPTARGYHTAVWTGVEMIVWGGFEPSTVNTGGRYDPATDSWTATSTAAGCPSRRGQHSAVWTGREMIVWGGLETSTWHLNTGGRYDPASDSWTPTSTAAPCPSVRRSHGAVWTGTEMIVWGGEEPPYQNTGGRYDPGTDTWRATSTITPCPSPRVAHTMVWTGREMIVWGGGSGGTNVNDTGGRYDPATDTWTATSTGSACPAPRAGHAAVWTGSEMIVWGGAPGTGGARGDGGRYDPSTDSWVPTSTGPPIPAPRYGHTGVWTGAEMIVWAGIGTTGWYQKSGGRYLPALDAWSPTSTAPPCPVPRTRHTAIWTGLEMIVWGGYGGPPLGSGGRYDPGLDAWTATSTTGAVPVPRHDHTAVWTGAEMIVWGGDDGSSGINSGGRYFPAADSWTATSAAPPCPPGRTLHTAIYTGSEMIVWGGRGIGAGITGARYAPSTDTWAPTSIAGAPSPRSYHTAVFTGSEMIVWGGRFNGGGLARDGARYAIASDVWTPTSTGAGCPSGRSAHVALWTGTEMIVWGGSGISGFENTGARYDPVSDAWSATTTSGACPSPRGYLPSVSTGSEMIVWGGYPHTATGAIYSFACPRVDYLVGAGLGQPNPPRARVYTPAGVGTLVDVLAYGVSQWGVNVASGAVRGADFDEILTGPGPGDVFGPHVRGWDRAGAGLGKVSFYAYGTLKHGVNVGSGDIDGDDFGEILTGAGPGTVFGPHVRGFDFDNATLAAIAKVSFFAYGTLQFGANVADGSVDADPYAEIATGPGPGPAFAPQVRGFDYDGAGLRAIAKINYSALPYAGYGVRLELGDVDGDGYAEIASTPGPGASHPWRYFGHGYDGVGVSPIPGFDVTPYAGARYGGRVGVGDVEADGRADLLCGAGPDPAADTKVIGYRYTASQQLQRLPVTFTPFLTLRYGVNVAAGSYGY